MLYCHRNAANPAQSHTERHQALVDDFYMKPPYNENEGYFLVDCVTNVDISAVTDEKRPSQKKRKKIGKAGNQAFCGD